MRNAGPVLVTDVFLSAPSPPETRPLPDPEDTYPCSVISEAGSGYDSFADQRRYIEWGRKGLHSREPVTYGEFGRRDRTDAANRALVLVELMMGERCWTTVGWELWVCRGTASLEWSSRSSGLVVSGSKKAMYIKRDDG